MKLFTRSFYSTSPFIKVAKNFSMGLIEGKEDERVPVIFEIKIEISFKNNIGRDIANISFYKEEKEWLLPYGAGFTIGKVTKRTEMYNS